MIQMLKCPSTTIIEQQTSAAALCYLMGKAAGAGPFYPEPRQAESFHWSNRVFEKGSNLMAQGEARSCVAVLLSGWAFRFQTLPDGKRQILDFVFAGALLGFGSGHSHYYGVEAITACEVATLPSTQFKRLLIGCPTLALQVAEKVADSEMGAHEHLTGLGRRTALERVAALIVELMERTQSSKCAQSAGTLELPITQIMIGDALGLSNEHVCRTLAKLAKKGLIELSRHALRVLDPKAVAIEAGKSFFELSGNKSKLDDWAA